MRSGAVGSGLVRSGMAWCCEVWVDGSSHVKNLPNKL